LQETALHVSQVGGERDLSEGRIIWLTQDEKVFLSIVLPNVYKYQLAAKVDR
jgi:hypothetical protein